MYYVYMSIRLSHSLPTVLYFLQNYRSTEDGSTNMNVEEFYRIKKKYIFQFLKGKMNESYIYIYFQCDLPSMLISFFINNAVIKI